MNFSLPRLLELAKRRAQPITVFDLETTTNIPYVAWMGVTEVGLLTIQPDGRLEETSAFVDPERNIPPFVRELTGITNKDVRGQPTWDVWKERFHEIAARIEAAIEVCWVARRQVVSQGGLTFWVAHARRPRTKDGESIERATARARRA